MVVEQGLLCPDGDMGTGWQFELCLDFWLQEDLKGDLVTYRCKDLVNAWKPREELGQGLASADQRFPFEMSSWSKAFSFPWKACLQGREQGTFTALKHSGSEEPAPLKASQASKKRGLFVTNVGHIGDSLWWQRLAWSSHLRLRCPHWDACIPLWPLFLLCSLFLGTRAKSHLSEPGASSGILFWL